MTAIIMGSIWGVAIIGFFSFLIWGFINDYKECKEQDLRNTNQYFKEVEIADKFKAEKIENGTYDESFDREYREQLKKSHNIKW